MFAPERAGSHRLAAMVCLVKARYLILTLCLVTIAVSSTARAQVLETTLNGFIFRIDQDSGCILRIQHPNLGILLDTPAEKAGLLTVSYPIPAFVGLQLEARYSHAVVTSDSAGISITWNQLGPSRATVALPTGNVRAVVHITAANDGESVLLDCSVENLSTQQAYQTLFPDFQGMRAFDASETLELKAGTATEKPFDGPVLPEDRTPFYPTWLWAKYPLGQNHIVSLAGPTIGISLQQETWTTQPAAELLTHRDEAEASWLRAAWRHTSRIEPGATWQSGTFRLSPRSIVTPPLTPGTLLYSGTLCDTPYRLGDAAQDVGNVMYTDCSIQVGPGHVYLWDDIQGTSGMPVWPRIGTDTLSLSAKVTRNSGRTDNTWYNEYYCLKIVPQDNNHAVRAYIEVRAYGNYVQTIVYNGNQSTYHYYDTIPVSPGAVKISADLTGNALVASYDNGSGLVPFSTVNLETLYTNTDNTNPINVSGDNYQGMAGAAGIPCEFDEVRVQSTALVGDLNAQANTCTPSALSPSILYSGTLCDTTYRLGTYPSDLGTLTYGDCSMTSAAGTAYYFLLNNAVAQGQAAQPVIGTDRATLTSELVSNPSSVGDLQNYFYNEFTIQDATGVRAWIDLRGYADRVLFTVLNGNQSWYNNVGYVPMASKPVRLRLVLETSALTAYWHDGTAWQAMGSVDLSHLQVGNAQYIDARGMFSQLLFRHMGNLSYEVESIRVESSTIGTVLNNQTADCSPVAK